MYILFYFILFVKKSQNHKRKYCLVETNIDLITKYSKWIKNQDVKHHAD